MTIDISKVEHILMKVCHVYFTLLALFFTMEPDLGKAIDSFTWGNHIIAKQSGSLLFLSLLVPMMVMVVYQRGGDE